MNETKINKFVRLKPESALTYSSIPLFDHRIIYPVLSETDDDVVVEMHPACSATSAKLAVPKTLIEKSGPLAELVAVGTWFHYSPAFLAMSQADLANLWRSDWPRDKDIRVRFDAAPNSPRIYQTGIVTLPISETQVQQAYIPIHCLIPAVPVEAEVEEKDTGGRPAKKQKPKFKHPKGDGDSGKLVRIIAEGTQGVLGHIWYITSYNGFRSQFRLNNGAKEILVSARDLELVDKKELFPVGQLVTQSDHLLQTGKNIWGVPGYELETRRAVMTVTSHANDYAKVNTTVLAPNASHMCDVSWNYNDLRALTDDEQKALQAYSAPTNVRDEAWLRRKINPSLMKLIDTSPTSPFLHNMIAGWLNVIINREVNTTKWLIAALIEQADKIKVDEALAPLYLSDVMGAAPQVAASTANAPVTITAMEVEPAEETEEIEL